MKKTYLFTALLASCMTLSAAVITPEQALQRARSGGAMKAKGTYTPQLLSTYHSADQLPTVYVFSTGPREGFVLLSADDIVNPVLGYSDSDTWDAANLPPQLEWWMGEYSSQIEYARNNPRLAEKMKERRKNSTRATEWDPISPMVTASWDQGYPYNIQCPMDGKSNAVTGCVATAMAQVMHYWKYPDVGTGSISYLNTFDGVSQLSMDFSEIPFDWSNMRDSYRGSGIGAVHRDAVAYLMKACGYSVKMNYSAGSSGAKSEGIPTAMRTYFKYDKDIQTLVRNNMGENNWNSTVYDQLKYIGPVIYSGMANLASRMGHCFVCDGYDKDGYFHINWGWGGSSNGYYLLSALDPDSLGIGGGDSTGYVYEQDIVIGITPPMGRLSVSKLAIGNASSDSGNVSGKGYIYRIDDPNVIEVTMTATVTGGPVSTPIELMIYETDATTMKNVGLVLEEMLPEKLNAPAGTTLDFSHTFSFKQFDPSKLYTLNAYYTLSGKREFIGNLRMAASSGVDEIIGESLFEIYDLGGRLVTLAYGENPSTALSGLAKGIYIVRSTDSSGGIITRKIVL